MRGNVLQMKLLPRITNYCVEEDALHVPDDAKIEGRFRVEFEIRSDGYVKIPGTQTWLRRDGLKKYFEFCIKAMDMLPIMIACLLL